MQKYKSGIIYYDEVLPRHILKGRECIWWEHTPGIIMKIEYKNIIRSIEFISYKKRKITYKSIESGEIFTSEINAFICRGGALKNIYPDYFLINIKWKHRIGDVIKGRYHDIKVINREIRKNKKRRKNTTNKYDNLNEKWYQCQCLDCGYDEIWIREDRPEKDIGCPACKGLVLFRGHNDLATTHPEVLMYLTNPEEACNYTYGDHAWLNTTCPICGYQKDMYISNLAAGKYICDNCSDGISYPEKFVFCVYQQLQTPFIYQYKKHHAEWCQSYIYDFYDINHNSILEIHGLQHYKPTTWYNLEWITENDKNKEYNAKNHVNKYIVIDARYSDKKYIRNSVLNSELSKWYDLSIIDWEVCDIYATKSYVLKAAELWNSGFGIDSIAKQISLSKPTIRKYLKRINNSNTLLINYNTEEIVRRRKLEVG